MAKNGVESLVCGYFRHCLDVPPFFPLQISTRNLDAERLQQLSTGLAEFWQAKKAEGTVRLDHLLVQEDNSVVRDGVVGLSKRISFLNLSLFALLVSLA